MPLYNPPSSLQNITVDSDGFLTLPGTAAIPFRVTETVGANSTIYRLLIKKGAEIRTIHEEELPNIPT